MLFYHKFPRRKKKKEEEEETKGEKLWTEECSNSTR